MATYRQVNHLADIDAAYIGGLIDGEGTVSLLRKHQHDHRQLVVSVSNTERPLLDYLIETIGAGKVTRKRTYSDRHTPSFAYSVTNRQALELLRQVAPYLRTYKAQRTTLILSHYLRLTPRNGKYSPVLAAERQEFIGSVMAIGPDTRGIQPALFPKDVTGSPPPERSAGAVASST